MLESFTIRKINRIERNVRFDIQLALQFDNEPNDILW